MELRAACVVAALLLAPTAMGSHAGAWYSYGTYEPDTYLDVPGLMWQGQPALIKNRVYFNVYASSGPGLAGANGEVVNPNVGALHTNVDPVNTAYFEAVLGVWTDCNGDGYIGMLETAVREYDARLLLNSALCPPVTGPKPSWVAGANNYNGWVTELIPIANREGTNADSRVYRDQFAKVWGDPGKPDTALAPPSGPGCEGAARGTWQSTGALLWWLDCQGNRGYVARFNELDAQLGLGMGFGADPRSSDSPLNMPTFGDEDSSNTAFTVQDCDAEPIVSTGDQTGDDLDDIALVRPVPGDIVHGDPTRWTVPGTLNATFETIWTPDGTSPDNTANCDYEDDPGQDFYGYLEGPVDAPASFGKDAAWSNFHFNTASRGTLPATAYPSSGVGPTAGGGSAGVPTDLGIEALGAGCLASGCLQSGWLGAFTTFSPPTLSTRGSILNADLSVEIASAPYFTFYAYVSSQTTGRGLALPGGSGSYGQPQCGENDSGMHNGWNCDAAAWYRRTDGTYPETPHILARVGDAYNLRDVDCFDGQLGDTELSLSPSFYGPAPCIRP